MTTDTETIGIGVIGAGKIAEAYHLPAIAATQGARLVAVADVVAERATEMAAKFGFAGAYGDWRRVIDRSDVDAVLLLTQYEARRQVVPAAAEAGKHVFTQKPLAGSVAEGEELAAVVRRAGVRLVTSFMHNYFPETRVTKRLLDEGDIGPIQFVRQRNAIRQTYARALELRGATWDIGPHGVGMIHHLTGSRIARVQAMMTGATAADSPAERLDVRDGRSIDTLAVMNYTLADGRVVAHEVHWTSAGGTNSWLTELFGSRGVLLLRPHVTEGTVAVSRRSESGRRSEKWDYPPVEPEAPRGLFHHQLFVDDVRFDRQESASIEDGLATLRVIEAAYRSAETGLAMDIAPSR
ncbi:MAG TPA: Gfo/Idh/MocA family oxidoreductase [Chloroflexota bacterium]|nr:Gfo/Idh/MocA family oxidoreductase [Chloroflexota bacterium]